MSIQMLDLLYDLSPEEGIAYLEGHLLVLLTEDDQLSEAVSSRVEQQVAWLDDASEFRLSICEARLFPDLSAKAQELPALLHFAEGRLRSVSHGADDSLEFFEEFVLANKCKRNNVNRR